MSDLTLFQNADLEPIATLLGIRKDEVTRKHLVTALIGMSVSTKEEYSVPRNEQVSDKVESFVAIGRNSPENGFCAFGDESIQYTLESGQALHLPAGEPKLYPHTGHSYMMVLLWQK